MGAIGTDLVETERSIIGEPENDPAPVWGIGADRSLGNSPLIIRYLLKVGAVWADDHNIGGDSVDSNISVNGEDEVLAIRSPILLHSNVKTERCHLKNVGPVNVRREQSRSGWVPIKADETELFPVGRNSRITAARANALPIIAVEVHAPKGFVVGHGIETMEYDPCPVGGESRIVLTNIRSRKFNQGAAIGIHDRDVTASTGRVVLKDGSGVRLATKLGQRHRRSDT